MSVPGGSLSSELSFSNLRRMARPDAQALLDQLREEIRRLQAAPPTGAPGVLPSGFGPLDQLLPGGGIPLGRVLELTGEKASGKTTLALMALARATGEGKLAAFIDASHEFYPPAAEALGVDLNRLLIVRPKDASLTVRICSLLARSGAFAAVAADLPDNRALPKGPVGRRLLEAAEIGRTAVILVSGVQSALDPSIRIAVERTSEAGLSLTVDRNRLGPPGRSSQGELGGDFAPPVARVKLEPSRRPVSEAPRPGPRLVAVAPPVEGTAAGREGAG